MDDSPLSKPMMTQFYKAYIYASLSQAMLLNWGQNKMATILQTTFFTLQAKVYSVWRAELNQCWPYSMTTHGITRPQWVHQCQHVYQPVSIPISIISTHPPFMYSTLTLFFIPFSLLTIIPLTQRHLNNPSPQQCPRRLYACRDIIPHSWS